MSSVKPVLTIIKGEPRRLPDEDILKLEELISRIKKGEVLEFVFATRESNGESHQYSSDTVGSQVFEMYGVLMDLAQSYRDRNIE